ncbi:MAG: hypothetical protein GXP55_15100 [Deltaproteobacteria bacterium]|nr:hypothetical protein [Deltaproteobacteria bacterium]
MGFSFGAFRPFTKLMPSQNTALKQTVRGMTPLAEPVTGKLRHKRSRAPSPLEQAVACYCATVGKRRLRHTLPY